MDPTNATLQFELEAPLLEKPKRDANLEGPRGRLYPFGLRSFRMSIPILLIVQFYFHVSRDAGHQNVEPRRLSFPIACIAVTLAYESAWLHRLVLESLNISKTHWMYFLPEIIMLIAVAVVTVDNCFRGFLTLIIGMLLEAVLLAVFSIAVICRQSTSGDGGDNDYEEEEDDDDDWC